MLKIKLKVLYFLDSTLTVLRDTSFIKCIVSYFYKRLLPITI